MAKSIRLSDGEWNLMNLLWERAPRTVTELVHALDTGWGKHTVMTMLSRLEAKGAVRWEQGERAREYYPAVDRAGVAMEETESCRLAIPPTQKPMWQGRHSPPAAFPVLTVGKFG